MSGTSSYIDDAWIGSRISASVSVFPGLPPVCSAHAPSSDLSAGLAHTHTPRGLSGGQDAGRRGEESLRDDVTASCAGMSGTDWERQGEGVQGCSGVTRRRWLPREGRESANGTDGDLQRRRAAQIWEESHIWQRGISTSSLPPLIVPRPRPRPPTLRCRSRAICSPTSATTTPPTTTSTTTPSPLRSTSSSPTSSTPPPSPQEAAQRPSLLASVPPRPLSPGSTHKKATSRCASHLFFPAFPPLTPPQPRPICLPCTLPRLLLLLAPLRTSCVCSSRSLRPVSRSPLRCSSISAPAAPLRALRSRPPNILLFGL